MMRLREGLVGIGSCFGFGLGLGVVLGFCSDVGFLYSKFRVNGMSGDIWC